MNEMQRETRQDIREDAMAYRNAAGALAAASGMSVISYLMPHEAGLPRSVNAVLMSAFGALAVVSAVCSGKRYIQSSSMDPQPDETAPSQ